MNNLQTLVAKVKFVNQNLGKFCCLIIYLILQKKNESGFTIVSSHSLCQGHIDWITEIWYTDLATKIRSSFHYQQKKIEALCLVRGADTL